MMQLRGYCHEIGTVDHLELHAYAPEGHTNPCPQCGGQHTCDTFWASIAVDENDIRRVLNDDDIDPQSNVFPGGSPSGFNPHLVVFVDHPEFSLERLSHILRTRVERHLRAIERTESIVIICRTKSSLHRQLSTAQLKPLVAQWRWFEPTFAPEIRFRTMDHRWNSRTY